MQSNSNYIKCPNCGDTNFETTAKANRIICRGCGKYTLATKDAPKRVTSWQLGEYKPAYPTNFSWGIRKMDAQYEGRRERW